MAYLLLCLLSALLRVRLRAWLGSALLPLCLGVSLCLLSVLLPLLLRPTTGPAL
jgi:hypothetical protein